jgi:hypothetical protein
VALDGYFMLKDMKKPSKKERKSIEFYQQHLAKLDRKLLSILNDAYEILHLYGYYDGVRSVDVVKAGFKNAKAIIEKIKPADLNVTT